MRRINVEEAVNTLRTLLEQVSRGEEIILVEQDREFARLVSPQAKDQWLASTKTFRESLHIQGEPLSATVIQERQGERF